MTPVGTNSRVAEHPSYLPESSSGVSWPGIVSIDDFVGLFWTSCGRIVAQLQLDDFDIFRSIEHVSRPITLREDARRSEDDSEQNRCTEHEAPQLRFTGDE